MSGPRAIDPRFHVPERRVIALVVFLAAVFWFARPVMLPFIVGALIAYAFSPYIDAAQARTGRSRLLIVVAGYGAGLLLLGLIVAGLRRPGVPGDRAAHPERAGRADDRAPPDPRVGQRHARGHDADTVEELAAQAAGRDQRVPPDARGRDPGRPAAAPAACSTSSSP